MSDDLRIALGQRRSVSSLHSISFEQSRTDVSGGATPVQINKIYLNPAKAVHCDQIAASKVHATDKLTQKVRVSLSDVEKGVPGETYPEANEKSESPIQGTFFPSLVALSMTTLGFGLLSLPSAFASSGVIMATALIILFGILTDVGLCIIIKIARATKQDSLESLAEYFYGRAFGKFVRYNLIFCLFLGIVSAFSIFMETWGRSGDSVTSSGLIRKYAKCGPTQCAGITKATVGIIGLILIFPILFQESLHGLRHVSSLAGLCLFASIGIFVYVYQDLIYSGQFEPVHDTVEYSGDLWGLCSVIGIAFMSFLCHFNVIPVYLELQDKEQIYSIIHTSILGVVIPVNLFIGCGGYFLFGKNVEGNVFDSMHNELGHVAAFTVALMSLLKLPLMFRPFKVAMFAELGLQNRKRTQHILTVVFAILAFVVAIFVNLQDISAIGGALSGAAISFLFPGMYLFAYSRSAHCQTLPLQDKADHDDELENSVTTRAESEVPSVAEPGYADGRRYDGKKEPVKGLSFQVEWQQLSRIRKWGVVLGLAFCAMALLSGLIGLTCAIATLVAEQS